MFDAADGTDRIYDFHNGSDRIQFTVGANHFSDLDIIRNGDDVRIAFAETVIILEDTRVSQIGAEDFVF